MTIVRICWLKLWLMYVNFIHKMRLKTIRKIPVARPR
jgi:hypothetical protein